MSSSAFSNFAKASAYTPPPDHSQAMADVAPPSRPSLPGHQSSNFVSPNHHYQPAASGSSSYQAGAIPTWGTSAGGGAGYDAELQEGNVNEWETRFGWRVDVTAAAAYILGPITALVFLILETHSDYIRFHSYQSALLTTPLVLLRLFLSLIHFPQFVLTLLTLTLVGSVLYMAFRAYTDANQGDLSRYHLPFIGDLADRWVGEE